MQQIDTSGEHFSTSVIISLSVYQIRPSGQNISLSRYDGQLMNQAEILGGVQIKQPSKAHEISA